VLRLILDSGPDGGNCPPVGLCRGFAGNCGDIAAQFADVPVLPDYPDGMADFVCTAFPDDANPLDTFLVGLLSIAVGLGVTGFIGQCFALANDPDPPDSILKWIGVPWPALIWGLQAHRKWHFTQATPPRHFVLWFMRCRETPLIVTFLDLCTSIRSILLEEPRPWHQESHKILVQEAQKRTLMMAQELERHGEEVEEDGEEEEEEEDEEEEEMVSRRAYAVVGVAAVYLSWTICSTFIFVCAHPCRRRSAPAEFSSLQQMACWCTRSWAKQPWHPSRAPSASPGRWARRQSGKTSLKSWPRRR